MVMADCRLRVGGLQTWLGFGNLSVEALMHEFCVSHHPECAQVSAFGFGNPYRPLAVNRRIPGIGLV